MMTKDSVDKICAVMSAVLSQNVPLFSSHSEHLPNQTNNISGVSMYFTFLPM